MLYFIGLGLGDAKVCKNIGKHWTVGDFCTPFSDILTDKWYMAPSGT